MKLITKDLQSKFPALYSNEDKPVGDHMVIAKFFTPDADWTWYATEYDPNEGTFFGLVEGFVTELGYFTLEQLENTKGPMGLPVERDLYFKNVTLKEIDPTLAAESADAPELA